MITRLAQLLLLIVAILVLAIVSLWTFGTRTVSSAIGERQIPATVRFGDDPFNVGTKVSLLPYINCSEGTSPLDLVILIDASSSMDGEPLDQAVAGAKRLLDVLDLTKHDVGIGLFNEAVMERIGLTNEQARLDALLQSATASGSTDINAALIYAKSEFSSLRRRVDALPVLLIFSDGLTGNDAAVMATATELKTSGVQIFVVGLESEDINRPLLEAIASTPESVQIAPSPAQLADLFEGIGRFIGNYVITDLTYREPIAASFAVDPASLTTGMTATTEGLNYQAEVLTKAEAEHFGDFTYALTPRRYGYHNINGANSTLSFVACGATAQRIELPAGPSLLVLPPLPFVLAIPAGLLLLAGLLFWLTGRRQRRDPIKLPDRSGPGPQPPPGPPPQDQAFAAWLAGAQDLEPEFGRTPNATLTSRPTLIVGVGSAGRTVLAHMAQNLSDRFGERWPETVQFLQISLSSTVEQANSSPLPNRVNEVTLARDPARLRIDQPHLRSAQGQREGVRQRGRLALFADLGEGKENSLLWGPLGKVLANRTNLTVWIVADAFGPASGMVADLAHLLRVRAGVGIIQSLRLCLAMPGARWGNTTRSFDLPARAYASLRELQRLQKISDALFAYTPDIGQQELRSHSKGKLLDEIYLFDGRGEDRNGRLYDISQLPAETGVLRVIGNGLLGLLEPNLGQSFAENERNAQTELLRAGGSDPENYGSAMGCAVVRAPINATRRLVELRLLHQALFGAREGLFGWGELDATGQQTPASVIQATARDSDVDELMQRTGVNAGAVLEPRELVRRLTTYLSAKMNDGAPLRLRWTISLLQALRLRGVANPGLDQVISELNAWLALVGESGATPTANANARNPTGAPLLDFSFDSIKPTREPIGAPPQTSRAPLPQQWQQHWDQARANFPQPAPNEPEQIAWTLNHEGEIFSRYFPEPANIVNRLRARVFWLWSATSKPELRLLILPNALTASRAANSTATYGSELRSNPYAFALRPEAVEQIIAGLLAATRPFSRAVDQEVVALYLKDRAVQTTLNTNASPLYTRVERGAERLAAQSYRYLLQPPDASAIPIEVDANIRLQGSDPACCLLLDAQHIVRLGNMQSYADAQQAYQSDANLFVFDLEQRAALRERAAAAYGIQRQRALVFSPATVALLESAEAELDWLGRLLVLGDIRLTRSGDHWTISIDLPSLAPLAGPSLRSLIEDFVRLVKSKPEVRNAIDQRLAEAQPDYAQRSLVQMQLDELAASADPACHDVAICIAWALENP